MASLDLPPSGKAQPDGGLFGPSQAGALHIERYFTTDGIHPFTEVEWGERYASITAENGEVIFEQNDVEMPTSWSQMATNVVVSKYFRVGLGQSTREKSLKTLITRVVETITHWGVEDGYFLDATEGHIFADELTHLLLHQKAAFNSPVWFNVGLESEPQCSACFINSVEDTMDSILGLARTEGMLFKFGSGTGTNFSTLRASKERLTSGGFASGPVSFMRGFDAFAGVIKSGGRTRRAAKMVILNIDHPDIHEFINCKAHEEKKAWALIDAGYDGSFGGEAYSSIMFQNSNNSVRVTDDFMDAVIRDKDWHLRTITNRDVLDTCKARELMREMAAAAHLCGDPGIQFDSTVNDWNTCASSGRINASNPCSEFMFLDDSACNLSSLNLMKFRKPSGEFDIESYRRAVTIMILAQEIIIDRASYPTPQIGNNSKRYRPLGLGYANLGALLMANGLAYDSDEGRALAAALTAIMTGQAYKTSAEIASRVGTFPEYVKNRESFQRVINKHRSQVDRIERLRPVREYIKAARAVWDEAIRLGEQFGYRNAQTSLLAPTGCLVGNALVLTDRGLMRLRRFGDPQGATWQDIHCNVLTDEGERQATKFYINGVEETRRLTTSCGYAIQGTLKHRIKVVDAASGELQWKHFADIRPGDVVALSMGQLAGTPHTVTLPPLGEEYWTGDYTTRVPRTMSPELAEFIGYFMGDGSLHAKGLRLCVAHTDPDVATHLQQLAKTLFNIDAHVTAQQGYDEIAVHSVPLTLWWEACGFTKLLPTPDHAGKGYLPRIPDAVLATNDPAVYGAFLRGLYEADGTVTGGVPCWSTVHREFSEEVKTLLLALGMPTTTKEDLSGWGQSTLYVLRLRNKSYTAPFLNVVGFIGTRKCEAVERRTNEQAARYDYVYLAPTEVAALIPAGSDLHNSAVLSQKRHGVLTRRTAQTLFAQTGDLRVEHALGFFYDTIAGNEDGGEQLTYDLSVPDNVTYIANGFISHNTIGFMMDCDTTGVEPDIALVKYKKLAGGGMFKIVNQTVPEAMKHLGYSEAQLSEILHYIEEQGTVEGAPGLNDEHLPVFDCAFKPSNGVRSIHYMGHLRMMSAVQPFLSGAISKTVNLPREATVDEIVDLYIEAWRLGLKSVAIYRDGSKRTQPLSTKQDGVGASAMVDNKLVEYRPMRRRLPDDRDARTHKFSVGGHEGYLTVGLYEDGTPGEIFVKMAKQGSVVSGLMDSFAIAISMALQYGVPLQALVDKFSHSRFEPAGWTNNKEIPMAKSIVDYIFRWLAIKYLPKEITAQYVTSTKTETTIVESEEHSFDTTPTIEKEIAALVQRVEGKALSFDNQSDAPPCPTCGEIMVRNGSCYKCLNCGGTSGCS